VNLGGTFYVLKVNLKNIMMRLLCFCDNGKGGKTRFHITNPLNVSGQDGRKRLEDYIVRAKKQWARWSPMEFAKSEDAQDFLAKKKKIDYDKVIFHSFSRYL
jgi:hypothetical protein